MRYYCFCILLFTNKCYQKSTQTRYAFVIPFFLLVQSFVLILWFSSILSLSLSVSCQFCYGHIFTPEPLPQSVMFHLLKCCMYASEPKTSFHLPIVFPNSASTVAVKLLHQGTVCLCFITFIFIQRKISKERSLLFCSRLQERDTKVFFLALIPHKY